MYSFTWTQRCFVSRLLLIKRLHVHSFSPNAVFHQNCRVHIATTEDTCYDNSGPQVPIEVHHSLSSLANYVAYTVPLWSLSSRVCGDQRVVRLKNWSEVHV